MFKYALLATTLAAVSTALKLLRACTNSDLSGNCNTWEGDVYKCYSMSEYDDDVSSAEVFEPIHCRLYSDSNCKGQSVVVTGPAYNLQEQNFNDVASSFDCYFP